MLRLDYEMLPFLDDTTEANKFGFDIVQLANKLMSELQTQGHAKSGTIPEIMRIAAASVYYLLALESNLESSIVGLLLHAIDYPFGSPFEEQIVFLEKLLKQVFEKIFKTEQELRDFVATLCREASIKATIFEKFKSRMFDSMLHIEDDSLPSC